MTAPKSKWRKRAGGPGKLKLEEIDDLRRYFSGEQASAWCLLLPGYENVGAEIRRHWESWQSEHPDAQTPNGLADILAEHGKVKQAKRGGSK
jgi:hypothetical protein